MPHDIDRLGARVRAVAAFMSVALVIAGCGGSSSPSVARLPTARSTPGSGSGPPREGPESLQQGALAFSKCMRSNGVPDFPDPNPSGGFLLQAKAGFDPSSPKFRAAQAKCHELMPGGGPPSTTNPSPRTLARFLRIARCMRAHGIPNFPDPRTTVPPIRWPATRA